MQWQRSLFFFFVLFLFFIAAFSSTHNVKDPKVWNGFPARAERREARPGSQGRTRAWLELQAVLLRCYQQRAPFHHGWFSFACWSLLFLSRRPLYRSSKRASKQGHHSYNLNRSTSSTTFTDIHCFISKMMETGHAYHRTSNGPADRAGQLPKSHQCYSLC